MRIIRQRQRTGGWAPVVVLALLVGSCSSPPHPSATTPIPPALPPGPIVGTPHRAALERPTPAEQAPANLPGLHNVVAYHEGFLSGSAPDGDSGFDALDSLGVRTIISVDGAAPDVARAKARGMRYIHLPIGYNGFDEARKRELVRATRDAMKDGPVYIHCHHGKHRSAGAAAAVAVSMGWLKNEEAIERMKVSGTAPGYTGLYACASNAQVLGASVIDAVPPGFPETSRPAGFVRAMVELDERFEHLRLIERAGWKTPESHPDLVPAGEAGTMVDLLRDVEHGAYTKRKPEEFASMLRENQVLVQRLEDMLAGTSSAPASLSAQLAAIGASCKACHTIYRD